MVRFDFLPSASFLSCTVYVFNWFWSTAELYHAQTSSQKSVIAGIETKVCDGGGENSQYLELKGRLSM